MPKGANSNLKLVITNFKSTDLIAILEIGGFETYLSTNFKMALIRNGGFETWVIDHSK